VRRPEQPLWPVRTPVPIFVWVVHQASQRPFEVASPDTVPDSDFHGLFIQLGRAAAVRWVQGVYTQFQRRLEARRGR